MPELVGKLLRKPGNILALFLLQVEKVRMRTGFKNNLHFKSNSLFARDIARKTAHILIENY